MNCLICGAEVKKVFDGLLLRKYQVSYYCCDSCGHLQTEKPYWLAEAYQSPINESDTGLLARNIYLSKVVSLICLNIGRGLNFLDFAGGYGVLTRLMRDVGYSFYWYDAYAKNIFASGFEYSEGRCVNRFGMVTSFETLEHFEDPYVEMKRMLKFADNILVSTTLIKKGDVPDVNTWWYYGSEHGQHISFFTLESLEVMARRLNLRVISNGSDLHFFSKSLRLEKFKILFWLFKGGKIRGLIRELLFVFVKYFNKSKTFQDMLYIKNR